MRAGNGTCREMPLALTRALWAVVLLLVVLGVAAAVGRGRHPADFITRAEPVRQWVMAALHREDPFALQRGAELARMDGRFAAHPFLILVHVLPGGAFLLFAPLQFSTRIRSRYPDLHRWSGRVLLLALLVTVLPGLYFGILIPYGGAGEALAIAVFGGALLGAVCRAFVAIRRRQVALHREWMIRVFAFSVAISSVRVVGAVFDVALTPLGFRPSDLFVASLWTGWLITVGAAEIWIRSTRLRRARNFATMSKMPIGT